MPEPASNQTNSTVWVQLFQYEGGELKAVGESWPVVLSSESNVNVTGLKDAVKEKFDGELTGISSARLQVYKPEEVVPTSTDATARHPVEPGTAVPIPDRERLLQTWDSVPTDTKGWAPLMVTAPVDMARQSFSLQHPVTPAAQVRHQEASLHMPSAGMASPYRPSFKTLPAPSADDGVSLKYVDVDHDINCSATSLSLHVLDLLEQAKKLSNDGNLSITHEQAASDMLRTMDYLERGGGDELQDTMGNNERLYTGAFCEALSFIMRNGIVVVHQGCLGKGPTHSDVSARYRSQQRSPTIMVCEGKLSTDKWVRRETRSQLLNELIRHRKIDKSFCKEDNRPILLVALNLAYMSLELAFPSTKGGFMETSGWVSFDDKNASKTETFWTVPVAMIALTGDERLQKLAIALKFIADTLHYLHNLPKEDTSRTQFKTPWCKKPSSVKPRHGLKCGNNVTILSYGEGRSSSRRVWKEFCYYLRQVDNFNFVEAVVPKKDQRWEPDQAVLKALAVDFGWYSSWEVESCAFGIKILTYPYFEGSNRPKSHSVWTQVLKQIRTIHSLGFVHGDLLPRNLLFNSEKGFVIDFDLMRREGSRYVVGYNHDDFLPYRHEGAKASRPMLKHHDIWALVKMSEEYFHLPEEGWPEDADIDVSDLIAYFESGNHVPPKPAEMSWKSEDIATDSPNREQKDEPELGSLVEELNLGGK